jgi:hypothetical protein
MAGHSAIETIKATEIWHTGRESVKRYAQMSARAVGVAGLHLGQAGDSEASSAYMMGKPAMARPLPRSVS